MCLICVSNFCNSKLELIQRFSFPKFLTKCTLRSRYFTCFDKYREELLAAYHKKAIFSLAVNSNSRATVRNATFGEYFRDSRNLSYVPTAGKHKKTKYKLRFNTKQLFFTFSNRQSSKNVTRWQH